MSQAIEPATPAREFKAVFRQPGFVVVFTIMLLAALGLNTAINAMGLYFKKEAVPLRVSLDVLPRQMGPWWQVAKDLPMSAEEQEALATKDYISREFIDSRLLMKLTKPITFANWESFTDPQRQQLAFMIRQRAPQGWIRLHMAYYTGLVDTVAHVPERCYVGGGFDPVNPRVVSLDAFKNDPKRPPAIKAKYIDFTDRAAGNSTMQNVAYFFQVNGCYEYDSLGGVRLRLQDIRERYAYYCKVELMTVLGDKSDVAITTMTDFLESAMPDIERSLPDWTKTTGKPSLLNTPRSEY